MAIGARELILILRATNQASGPIRQVARDLRTLGDGGAAAGRGIDAMADKRRWARMGAASAVLRDTSRSARLVGIGVGAGLGFAATAAAKFQTQAGLVATQTGAMNLSIGRTTAEMQRNAKVIQQGVLVQMSKFPAAAEEMNDSLYEIFSSTELGSQGIDGVKDGLKLLNLMNKAAVAGQTDLSEVTKAATSVMNAFGGGVKAMPKRLERMFAAVRFGRMTFADFTSTFSQIVPATQAAGQSFDTMTGTMAALTRLMPNVRFAATAYARMLEIFGRKKFVDGAKKFGVEMQDAKGNLRPLPRIIDDFRVAISKLPLKEQAPMIRNFFKALSNQEGTIQARRAFTALIKHPELYRKVLGQTVRDNNEFTKSFRLMADTAGVKWETFVNRMRATFIKLGAAAIPVLMQLLEPLGKLADAFMRMDKGTREMVVRWAVIGSAIAIIGGTIGALVGHLGTFLAAFRVAPVAFLGTITALSAALLILAGRGDLVAAAMDNLATMATSSWKSFIVTVGLATVAVLRLKSAIMATSAVSALTGGAGAAGGILGGIGAAGGRFRDARRTQINPRTGKAFAVQLGSATRNAGALRAALAGTAIASAATATALLPTIGIVAAISAGVLLWSRHQKKVADEAARLAQFRAAAATPTTAAQNLGGLGQQIVTLREAKINLRDVNFQIKEQKKNMVGLTGSAREQAKINLDRLWIRYGEAVRDVSLAQQRIVTSSTSLNNALKGVSTNLRGVAARRAEIADLRKQFEYMAVPPSRVTERIARLQQEIKDLERGAAGFGPVITRSMGQALRMLERIHQIPQMTGRQFELARGAAARFATATGRAPSLKEFRQIVRAVLDPSSVKNIPAQIRQAVGVVKIEAKIEVKRGRVADLNRQVQDAFRHREPTIAPKAGQLIDAKAGLRQAQAARAQMAGPFRKAIEQQIKVKPPANLEGIGRSISQGIQAGMLAVHQQVVIDKVVNSIERGFLTSMDAKSPSKRFAKTVGMPIVQGMIVGILSMAKEAGDAAVFAIDTIEGKTTAKMTQFLKKQGNTIRGMNTNLQQLVNRKVPMQLIEQLAQMGTQGAAQIKKLAGSTKSELAKFVAAWRSAQSAVNTSARFNWTKLTEFIDAGAQKLLDIYNTARDTMQSFLMGALQDTTKLGQEIADSVVGAIGGLFQGPMNISDHIGAAFDSAMDSYRSSAQGLQDQMEELQKRQADTIRDFMERRRDELRSAFGTLFQGPILSGGFAAGSVKDLIADLERQMQAFQDWRKNLDTLGKRGVPKALMKELEKLGPEASQNMSLLVNATDEDLQKWVAAWQNGQNAIEEVTQATFMDMEGFAEAMADIAEQMAEVARQMSALQAPKRADFAMLLADLQAQQAAWTDYNDILTSLHNKHVPALLLSELAKMGVEGVEILRILNTATPEELAKYVATWMGLQTQLDTAKKGWLAAISPDEILKGLQDTTTALTDWGNDLAFLAAKGMDPAILAQLRQLGPEAAALIDGIAKGIEADPEFLKKFEGLWTTAQGNIDRDAKIWVNEQIALWKQHGSNIAGGIIAGVMEEQGRLFTFFRSLFSQLLQEAKKETRGSGEYMAYHHLGQNMVLALQAGLNSVTPIVPTPVLGSVGGGMVGGAPFSHRPDNGINMTVNAHNSEALQSTLERSAFRMRQRRVN